ncbi:hypothetical protein EDD75_0351 [Thermodesulfitimonas autotrophica]|uniref:Uncharacterized protein n=1 Tax=Thermodesulfitimonas autotrophica TaxID=1894989 RepID=A0A3N5BUG9_9THEO|nr:hypothetical protein [Thermodesulfitimonas autotrophica]RPF49535.1 hypothetical protein EDD75_0351 [Thermodesulfitimonas autotrophica]
MPNGFPSASFQQITEELFAAAERLREASKKLLPLEEAEKLVAEAEDAAYRCRRAVNSARLLGKRKAVDRHTRV